MLAQTQIEKLRRRLKKDYDKKLPLIFSALGDHCRFFIFQFLIMQKEACVTDVSRICNITMSAASQQLKTLEMSGIVVKERMGQMVCYKLHEEDIFIKSLVRLLTS